MTFHKMVDLSFQQYKYCISQIKLYFKENYFTNYNNKNHINSITNKEKNNLENKNIENNNQYNQNNNIEIPQFQKIFTLKDHSGK